MWRPVFGLVFLISVQVFGQSLPDLTQISPTTGLQGSTVNVTLSGTNFVNGTTNLTVGSPGIQVLSLQVNSATSAVATLVLTATPGRYPLLVSTGAGAGLNPQTFTVLPSRTSYTNVFDVGSFFGPDGGAGSSDGGASETRFAGPAGIWTDGTFIYVADTNNGTIRKVNAANGQTTTIAGTPGTFGTNNGTGADASFRMPVGIWGNGTNLYITDGLGLTIRKLELSSGKVTTLAGSPQTAALVDGTGTDARFVGPTGIWGDGTNLYVADSLSATTRSIRKVGIATGVVTTVADLGKVDIALYPVGLWGDSSNLYIADSAKQTVRRMSFASSLISTFAGRDGSSGSADGQGSIASFYSPRGIWGNATDVFVADTFNFTIRRISIATAQVSTLAGVAREPNAADGPGSTAKFGSPDGVTGFGSNLFVAEFTNHDIRRIAIDTGTTGTVAGRPARPGSTDGQGSTTQFFYPYGMTGDPSGIYISDQYNSTIRKIDSATSVLSTYAGRALFGGFFDSSRQQSRFGFPSGLWSNGLSLFIADAYFDNIRKLDYSSQTVTTVAGNASKASGYADGVGTNALFNNPLGIWGNGTTLYVVDSLNYLIRKISIANGAVTTLAGNAGLQGSVDGIGTGARFYSPSGVWGDGANLYVTDAHAIRKISLTTGQVATFAGNAVTPGTTDGPLLAARFRNPRGIWGDGTNLFIADADNNLIRRIELQTGMVTTIAGLIQGSEDGRGAAGRVNSPTDIWGDGNALYVVDSYNHRIRKLLAIDPTSFSDPGDLTYGIPDRGAVSRVSAGGTTSLSGYARILPTRGTRAPAGMAIFGFHQNGTLVSEAAVPASPLILSGRIYAEIDQAVNTGIAIANPNSQTVKISFYYTDAAGVNQLAGTTTIGSNSQIAAFLDQAPFINPGTTANLAAIRSFTFSASAPVGVITLRGLLNERSEFLLTTLPVIGLDDVSTTPLAFSHYADGGGWKTQVVLINPTDSPITGTVRFFSQGNSTTPGALTSVTINGATANTFSYTIAPRASVKLVTSGTSEPPVSGWVQVSPAPNNVAPGGLVIFTSHPTDTTVSEASVAAIPLGTSFRLYAEVAGDFKTGAAGSIQTGFAINNPGTTAAAVNLELVNMDGSSTGLKAVRNVPPSGQIAMFLFQIPGFEAVPANFQGILRISGTNIGVAGLRGRINERGDFLITTTAPVSESTVTSTEQVFPHLVDGGGYTTQFVLFPASPGPTSTGIVRFFSQSGDTISILPR